MTTPGDESGPSAAKPPRIASTAPSSAPLVRAIDVHKSFGSVAVLQGVDLTVEEGEVCCLLGRSGSGKSTFLRCLNNLEPLTRGQVHIAGDRMGYERHRDKLYPLRPTQAASQRRKIGMVFQRFNLFPHLTALQNVTVAPTRVLGTDVTTANKRALDLLASVGLGDRADHYPTQLSGGQQQRVAIARALAMDPQLMLFDEPTSALDPELVGEVLDTMRNLADEGMTMIVVTHEMAFAREVADSIVFMDDGQVVERGTSEQVLANPRAPETQAFLSRIIETQPADTPGN